CRRAAALLRSCISLPLAPTELHPAAPRPAVALLKRLPASQPWPALASLRRRHGPRSAFAAAGGQGTGESNRSLLLGSGRQARDPGVCGGGVVLGVVVYLNDCGHGQGRCGGKKARTPWRRGGATPCTGLPRRPAGVLHRVGSRWLELPRGWHTTTRPHLPQTPAPPVPTAAPRRSPQARRGRRGCSFSRRLRGIMARWRRCEGPAAAWLGCLAAEGAPPGDWGQQLLP
ncbi:unnamed protein product, partial [Urochloa humidicola]